MWKQLMAMWIAFKADALQLWFALGHPDAPTWLKAGAAGVLLYLVSPVDLIPDMLPVIGVVDDLILVPMAVRWLLRQLPPHIRQYAQERSRGGTGTRKNTTRPRR
jgi:uncharacterized membrane protein YkvA (DUF1232 family)